MLRGFEFRNVSFHYPGSTRLILNHLNFELRPGQRVALIGENGQGKTTFVKLITRLYDPTEGQILLDGIDLREYDLEDLHREMGVIFQIGKRAGQNHLRKVDYPALRPYRRTNPARWHRSSGIRPGRSPS